MGILDDAIKEHLELKRRHGVPEEELQRQEEEALGPARRDVAQQPEGSENAPGQEVADEAGDGQAAATTAVADHEPPAAEQETALFDMEEDAAHAGVPPTAPATEEHPAADATPVHEERSEERRVGKECRSRGSPEQQKKKTRP